MCAAVQAVKYIPLFIIRTGFLDQAKNPCHAVCTLSLTLASGGYRRAGEVRSDPLPASPLRLRARDLLRAKQGSNREKLALLNLGVSGR